MNSNAMPKVTSNKRVLMLTSRFPKLTETFILNEYLELASAGVDVTLAALFEEPTTVTHAEVEALLPRVRFFSPTRRRVLLDAAAVALRHPLRTTSALFSIVRWNAGNARMLSRALGSFPSALALGRTLRREGYDHLHAHFVSVPGAMAWVANRVAGVPYSMTAHGSDLHRAQNMLRQKVDAAEYVVTVSEYNANILSTHRSPADPTPIHIVRCGVDLDAFNRNQALDERSGTATRLICVGSLHEVKGQRYLLDALRLLQQRSDAPEVELTVIGDGVDRESLSAYARQHELPVRFLGALPRTEVARHYRSSDIALVPSVPSSDGRKEGLPVSLVEAMASGCAVVASRLTGIPELVRHDDTGLLVEPGDANAIADALLALTTDAALRQRLASRGRALVEDQYDLQANCRQLAALLA